MKCIACKKDSPFVGSIEYPGLCVDCFNLLQREYNDMFVKPEIKRFFDDACLKIDLEKMLTEITTEKRGL